MKDEYQLKIGVAHLPTLRSSQLIKFLENESNQFLRNELPQHMEVRESFVSSLMELNSEPIDCGELVGLIILYSTASFESFLYAKARIPSVAQLRDIFLLFVEMDNTEKKLNVVGDEGERLCNKLGLVFIKLSLNNCEEVVTSLNRSLYYLIENYYYPNEDANEDNNKGESQQGNEDNDLIKEKGQYVIKFQDQHAHEAVAVFQEKETMMSMLQKASTIRRTKEVEIQKAQREIDDSAKNVQTTLNYLNCRIKQKLTSEWYSSLNDFVYKPIQKRSTAFSKIKLTQQFIDDVPCSHSVNVAKYNTYLDHKRVQPPLLKVIIMVQGREKTASTEIQVYESSTYEQLTVIALQRLAISDNKSNRNKIFGLLQKKIQSFVKQLIRAIQDIQKQKIYQRSYLQTFKK